MAATRATYGSWVSPISSDVVIKESISLMEVCVDPFQEGKNMKANHLTLSLCKHGAKAEKLNGNRNSASDIQRSFKT